MSLAVEPAVVAGGDAVSAAVLELLAQEGAGIDGVESMRDSVEKVASMVQYTGAPNAVVREFSVAPAAPASVVGTSPESVSRSVPLQFRVFWLHWK